ncbi:SprT family zinc-dependent metalloprotease [Morganella morganii]|uniref:SprT family zinc-dependent metalloprotease n=1 Tax=Morganella morganii TaxID=582 RepID=UPI000F4877F2|nr:SprT family zinc-dependent metalloprotease [Morganella morganii]
MKPTRVPTALQQACMQTLRDYLARACRVLKTDYPEPELNYRQRGTTAGSACLQTWEIRLNPVLLTENGPGFIQDVVPHELAHLLVYRRFGRVAPHGREWQWMMTEVLGVPAVRTHRFDVTSVRARTFIYRCQCKTAHELTVRRHNKVLRGESQYLCRHCKSTLVWDNSAAAISSPCDLTPDQS